MIGRYRKLKLRMIVRAYRKDKIFITMIDLKISIDNLKTVQRLDRFHL